LLKGGLRLRGGRSNKNRRLGRAKKTECLEGRGGLRVGVNWREEEKRDLVGEI
jgi:hypothetical protein